MLNVKEDFRSLEFLNVFNWAASDLFDLLTKELQTQIWEKSATWGKI